MVIFQVVFFILLSFELLIAVAVKKNWFNLQDRLIKWFNDNDIERYIRNEFPNSLLWQIVVMFALLILCLC